MVSSTLQFKPEFFTGLAGVIMGMLAVSNMIITYLFFSETGETIFQDTLFKFSGNFNPTQVSTFISSVVGLVLGVLMIVYLNKITKNPTQQDFIIFTILGAIALFTPFFFGGLLVLIAGIVGIARVKK